MSHFVKWRQLKPEPKLSFYRQGLLAQTRNAVLITLAWRGGLKIIIRSNNASSHVWLNQWGLQMTKHLLWHSHWNYKSLTNPQKGYLQDMGCQNIQKVSIQTRIGSHNCIHHGTAWNNTTEHRVWSSPCDWYKVPELSLSYVWQGQAAMTPCSLQQCMSTNTWWHA